MHIRESGTAIALPRPPRGWQRQNSAAAEPTDTFVPSTRPADQPPPPAVGSQRPFWVWDFAVMPPAPKQISTTLRAVGDHGCIWVDDAAWGKTVTQTDVDTLDRRFNRESTAGAVDPRAGIGAIDKAYFGEPPHNIDPDARATVLITDFASFHGTTMDGYFNPFDQMKDEEAQQYGQHSNEKNIIYLNSTGSNVSSDYMLGVLAHEFSHLCQFAKDPDKDSWLGETLAETAMVVNGYHTDIGHVARHQTRPQSPLETPTYVDYGAAYLFGTYMLERYGKNFITRVAEQTGPARDAIDQTLQKCGSSDRFSSLFDDWVVANYADSQPVVKPPYQYASLDVPPPAVTTVSDKLNGSLEPTGVAYLRADSPQVQVQADGACSAQLISVKDGLLEVQRLDASQPVTLPTDGVLALAATGDKAIHYAVTPTK